MKFCVLCGGSGSRLQSDTSFPKPLNHVLGVPLIEHVLKTIPSDEVTIILTKGLVDYNFDSVIHHLTDKKVTCVYLDRPTRGAVETAYLGLQKLDAYPHEPICFVDNDTVYNFPPHLPSKNFIGYSVLDDPTKYHPYSFLNLNPETQQVYGITEKVQVSTTYACGVYGFQSVNTFMSHARDLLLKNHFGEFYMSSLYNHLLGKEEVVGVEFIRGLCLGTPDEVAENIERLPSNTLRICFDIDNTLIKYRAPGQTYSQCEANYKMIDLLKKLKTLGHTIILHTARGMRTARQNVGLAMKTVAADTFESLEKLDIPYDEIYFGKPDADLYIDDKAFNPYINLLKSIGFENLDYSASARNTTNKFNSIRHVKDTVIKRGPPSSMKGEIYFYKTVEKTSVASHFPRYIDSGEDTLQLQFIDGFTLFDLLKDGLLTEKHLDQLVDMFNDMHTSKEVPVTITTDLIYENYMGKLKKRAVNREDYPFDNTGAILWKIDPYIKDYLSRSSPASIVHGDPWFSNTLMTRGNKMVFLDMKGDIAGTLTTNGDAMTDFGKILQSLLGFDYIVNGMTWDDEKLGALRSYYISKVGIPLNDLYAVTACLVAKTLSFLDVDLECRRKVWSIIEYLASQLEHQS